MSRNTVFGDGLEAAAKYLEGSAADYDEMADVRDKYMRPDAFGFIEAKRETLALRDKAKLLRGQAEHIRSLRS